MGNTRAESPALKQDPGSSGGERSTQRRQQLSRDDRIRVLILREAGKSYAEIANILGITQRQVQHTVNAGHPTPKKRSGRPELLSEEQKTELVDFVRASEDHRMMSYTSLAKGPFAHWNVSEYPIRRALEGAGFKRNPSSADDRRQERERIRRIRPTVTRRHRQNRFKWARAHHEWSVEDWKRVLWTTEAVIAGFDQDDKLRVRRFDEDVDFGNSIYHLPSTPVDATLTDALDASPLARQDSPGSDLGGTEEPAESASPTRLSSLPTIESPSIDPALAETNRPAMPEAPMQLGLAADAGTGVGTASMQSADQSTKPGLAGIATTRWIAWACFCGGTPGPLVAWDDKWGDIVHHGYLKRILPIIGDVARQNQARMGPDERVQLMQDSSAPFHRARPTMVKLEEMKLPLLDKGSKWPSQSPDLNPFVDLWAWVAEHANELAAARAPQTEDELKALVGRAWQEAITPARLDTVLAEMPARCRDVMAAKGGWTHWWKPRHKRKQLIPPSALSATLAADQDGRVEADESASGHEAGLRNAITGSPTRQTVVQTGPPAMAHFNHITQHFVLDPRGLAMGVPIGLAVPVTMPLGQHPSQPPPPGTIALQMGAQYAQQFAITQSLAQPRSHSPGRHAYPAGTAAVPITQPIFGAIPAQFQHRAGGPTHYPTTYPDASSRQQSARPHNVPIVPSQTGSVAPMVASVVPEAPMMSAPPAVSTTSPTSQSNLHTHPEAIMTDSLAEANDSADQADGQGDVEMNDLDSNVELGLDGNLERNQEKNIENGKQNGKNHEPALKTTSTSPDLQTSHQLQGSLASTDVHPEQAHQTDTGNSTGSKAKTSDSTSVSVMDGQSRIGETSRDDGSSRALKRTAMSRSPSRSPVRPPTQKPKTSDRFDKTATGKSAIVEIQSQPTVDKENSPSLDEPTESAD